MFAHLLHAQPEHTARWTYLELLDRVDWLDEYLKPRQ